MSFLKFYNRKYLFLTINSRVIFGEKSTKSPARLRSNLPRINIYSHQGTKSQSKKQKAKSRTLKLPKSICIENTERAFSIYKLNILCVFLPLWQKILNDTSKKYFAAKKCQKL
jgi:hypothetical protein